MATITFKNAQRWYPNTSAPAVPGVNLEIAEGEFMVLVGPSGCGKTTTLRMLAGLEEVDGGQILIGDRDVTTLASKDRDIAMVFQNYALYPHMTVADNMAFSLKMAKVPAEERKRRVAEAAEVLGLTDYLDRKPKALSGGQRQRVAMGRAIVRKPHVFCMDEPLSNLDAKMRVQTRTDIAKLQRELGVTTVYVTHDQVEAMTMGDRVAVMNGGVLQQVDTPLGLYDRPANLFVAGFIGSPQMNLIEGIGKGDAIVDGAYSIPIDAATAQRLGDHLTVGIRSEHLRVVADSEPGITVDVALTEHLGSDNYVHGTAVIGGVESRLVVRLPGHGSVATGARLRVAVDPDRIHVFDTATGARLSD